MPDFAINSLEANRWWQKNSVAGVLLNRLMLLFIVVPIVLVSRGLYPASFVVFVFIVPYGFLMRYLAVRAVRQWLVANPETLEEFTKLGVVRC